MFNHPVLHLLQQGVSWMDPNINPGHNKILLNDSTGARWEIEEKIIKTLLIVMAMTSVLALGLIGFFCF